MINEYLQQAIQSAKYELHESGNYVYGEIPACPGVYTKAENFEACRNELLEILEEWLLIRIKNNLEIPEINGRSISFSEAADASV